MRSKGQIEEVREGARKGGREDKKIREEGKEGKGRDGNFLP